MRHDEEYEYTVVPTIRYESTDEPLHTDEQPYCGNPGCPCMSVGPLQYGLERLREELGQMSIYQMGG